MDNKLFRRLVSLEKALRKLEKIARSEDSSDLRAHVCFLKWHKIKTKQEAIEAQARGEQTSTEQIQQLKEVADTYKRLLGIGEELPPWKYIDDDEDLDDA